MSFKPNFLCYEYYLLGVSIRYTGRDTTVELCVRE